MDSITTTANQKQNSLHRKGQPTWVQCAGFRCMAYLDGRGKWRTFFNDEELSNVIAIADLSAEAA